MSTPNDFLQHVKNNNLKAVENTLETMSYAICCRGLEFAAENGLKEMTECLLFHIGGQDPYNFTAIFEALVKASINGHLEIVKNLVAQEHFFTEGQYSMPLVEAAGHNQLAVVEFLFPLYPTDAQMLAMTEACRNSQYEVSAYLIDKVDLTHEECEGFEYAARMAVPKIFDLFELHIPSLPLDKRITALTWVASNLTPRAVPMIKTLLKHIPEDSNVSEALLYACVWGQQNNAAILYERADTNWVLEQLHLNRRSDYDNWKFFDQWVQAQQQKIVLDNEIQNPLRSISRKKL